MVTQKSINKIEEILNNNKLKFDNDINYIIVVCNNSIIYKVKAEVEIYIKYKNINSEVYNNKFFVYNDETYEQATNNFLMLLDYQNELNENKGE